VIVHDGVRAPEAAIRRQTVGHLGEEALVVGGAAEHARPPVAARGHVVKTVCPLDAWWTSHPAFNASKGATASSAIHI